jgi:hypothetical protein
MSDFLSNLVARTMAQPALRPRTRSRFEEQTQSQTKAQTSEEAPLVWPEAGASSESRAIAQAAPAGRVATEIREVGGVRQEARTLPSGETPLGQPAGRRRSIKDEDGGGAPAGSVKPVKAETAGEMDRPVEMAETTERVVRVPVAARPHRYDEQPPRIVERRGPREIEEVERERVVHHTIERTRRVSDRARQSADASPAPEPVIQVSIGRIEVRAVPAAPPARGGARGGTMTIDDYVAKRRAKERR